ncbi:carnosine synthase 1 isoform X3 [Nycticebus coucang]|uniref:carnosine synthase 1 isoform X3 n=1 Tax=Nycticebus coucang TaxID=9470 RepID=UPI00234C6ECA|nr:carnosine synthase 1 isoform X3 [Nycticebus coucang]
MCPEHNSGWESGGFTPLSDFMCPFAHPAQDPPLLPPQLSLDPLNPRWNYPLGSKDLEEEDPWGGGSGLPPTGCFPGSWHQDVGLDCKGAPEGAKARAWTAYYYHLLQSCLQQAGLPETQDRSQVPRTGCPGAEVTLCILGSPSTFLSVLLEGGVQSPGNMLLCLSSAWLMKVPAPGQPGGCEAKWLALAGAAGIASAPAGRARSSGGHCVGAAGAAGGGREHPGGGCVPTCPAALPSPSPGPELAVRICAVVCRTQGDRPLLSKVVCSVGRGDRPLRHQNSLPRTLEVALAQCGLGEAAQVAVLRQRVKAAAEDALAAVLALEAGLSAEQRGGRWARIDFLGVDFALTVAGRALTPVALELNGGLCLEACSALEGLWAAGRLGPAADDAAAAPLVETMLRRSAHYLMEGKQLLVIGAGGVSKKFVWEAARDYGLKLHLVESDPNHFASQLVQTFIHFDLTEHRKDEENARLLAELVRARGLQLDGCFSYWDDCLVLTALLCQELGLRCNPPAAMRLAKQKSCTQLHLLDCHGPPWPAPSLHAVACCPLESEADMERAVHQVPLPGVMKLEFGAGAVGVRLVEDAPQCHEHFSKIARDLQGEADHPGIGLGWGNAMLLMEYVEGTEHDVDLVLFGGRLLAAFVSDNGPTRLPGFTETAACMPTGLAPEQEAQMVQAAYRCCLGCGLLDGVFNVELKLTGAGPRLIEINPRMGGFYLRDWILELYGVDLLLAAAMVACGLRPALPTHPRPRGHLVGVMCLVSQHLQALSSTASHETLQALHDQGLLRLNMLEEALVPREYEEPYCSVACAGPSPAEARLRLLGLCQGLGIDGPNYPVAHFLSHFK